MKLRVAVFEDIKKIVYREDYPKPIPGPNDALVKVHYCGICGSDVTNFKQGLYKIPLIMGHEFSGEIAELGEKITDFKVGDKVLGINVLLDVTENLQGLGVFQNGGFAEYARVPKEFLFHAPESTPMRNCTMIESYAFAIRAVKLSRINENQNVVIIGGGNVGLTTLSVLLIKKKPNYVIVIEPHELLRIKAKELGATETFPLGRRRIRKFFGENGAPNYIFDCAGNDKSFNLALDLIKRGGTIILEGIYRGTISFPLLMINSKEICLQGVMGHDREDILESIELFTKKMVDPSKIISEVVPLKGIQKAFEKYLDPKEREFIKIVIKI